MRPHTHTLTHTLTLTLTLTRYSSTELGDLVGALSGDNELWLALVLIEVAAAPQPSLA